MTDNVLTAEDLERDDIITWHGDKYKVRKCFARGMSKNLELVPINVANIPIDISTPIKNAEIIN